MKKERIKNMVHLKNHILKEFGDLLRKYGEEAKKDSLFSYWKLLLRSKLIPLPEDVRVEYHHGFGKKLSELSGKPVDNSPDNLFPLIEDSKYLSGCYEHGYAHKYSAHSKILVDHFGKEVCQQAFIDPYHFRWSFLEENENFFVENNCIIPIITYCIETREIKEYPSISSASIDLEVDLGNLAAVAREDQDFVTSKKNNSHYWCFPKSSNDDLHLKIENYEKKIKKKKRLSSILKIRNLVESGGKGKITSSSNRNVYEFCRTNRDNINVKKLFDLGIIQISDKKGRITYSKSVIIFKPDTLDIVNEFNSITDASRFYSISRSSIYRNCLGKSILFKDKFGFEVKFKEDFEELKNKKTEP